MKVNQKYPRVYFGAADIQMSPFIDEDYFRRDLILDVLFRGNLVIPDAFWLMGEFLGNAAKNKDRFLYKGLETGAIRPWFRRKRESGAKIYSFMDAYSTMDKRIGGLRKDARVIGNKLDREIAKYKNFKPGAWPKTISAAERFEETIVTYLQKPKTPPSERDKELCNLWEKTKEWRTDCVVEAIDKTRLKGSRGLQRGELLISIARTFGYKGDIYGGDIRNLKDLIKLVSRVAPDSAEALTMFFYWVTACYQYSQSNAFKAECSFSNCKGSQISFLNSFLLGNQRLNFQQFDGFYGVFEFPPVKYLLSPELAGGLLDIRHGEEGQRYFEALETWKHKRDRETADKLANSLRIYGNKITKLYERKYKGPVNYLDILFPDKNIGNFPDGSRLLLDWLGRIPDIPLMQGIATYMLIYDTASFVYRCLPHRKIKKFLIGIRPTKIEIPHEREMHSLPAELTLKRKST